MLLHSPAFKISKRYGLRGLAVRAVVHERVLLAHAEAHAPGLRLLLPEALRLLEHGREAVVLLHDLAKHGERVYDAMYVRRMSNTLFDSI